MHTSTRSLAALAAFLLASPAGAIVIQFNPSEDTVSVGDEFSVDIVVTGLDAAGEAISAFDLFIGFDPAIIAPVSVTFGPGSIVASDVFFELGNTFDLGMSFFGTTGLGSASPFSVSSLSLSPPAAAVQGDSVLLASLTFDALAAGFSDLLFLDPAVSNVSDDIFVPPALLAFERVGSGAITVEAPVSIPEPGILMLLGTALLLVRIRRWRGPRR